MLKKMVCLFVLLMAMIINGESGKVYLVVGSDTAIWDGLSISQYDNRYFKGHLYADPAGNAYTVMDTSFRLRLKDSFGTPMKMTWWMMAGNVFHLSRNCNIPIRNNITLYLMKKYHMDAINAYDDQLTLHYHNYYWSDTNGDNIFYYNQGLDFLLNEDDYEECLMKYLIEDDVFPVSFRSGWHYMDNAWQSYQEKFIPFDMSNAYPSYGGDYNEPTNNIIDWSESPSEFVPYHPNANNYQIKGDLKQWRLRSICFTSINWTRENLEIMFQEAANGNDQMACFWSHLPQTDFMLGMDSLNAIAHRLSNQYNVDFMYCKDTEAMGLWINPEDTIAPVLTVNEIIEGDNRRFTIETDGPVFQTDEPFVAMKTKNETYQRLSCSIVSKNRWETVNAVPADNIAKISVTVCDSVGNQAKTHLDYLTDDIYIDDKDNSVQELSGTWNDYNTGELWNLSARKLEGTGSVSITPSIETPGIYSILFHGPGSTSDSAQCVVNHNGIVDTVFFNKVLSGSDKWQHVGFFEMSAGTGNKLILENLATDKQFGLDVVRFTPLVADRKMVLNREIISFGDVSVTDSAVQYLSISNFGRLDLRIESIVHDGDKITIDAEFPMIIGAMEEVRIPIIFSTDNFCDYSDVITIQTNDMLNPTVIIPVVASATSLYKLVDNDEGQGYHESNHVWFTSVATSWGPTSRCVYISGNVGAYADFTETLKFSGSYDVQYIVPKTENATNNACYVILIDGIPLDSVYVDQNAGSGAFVSIREFDLPKDILITLRIAYYGGDPYPSGKVLRADAVKFILIEEKEVGVSQEANIPLEFGLMQNYPNPFNNRTTIEYALAAPSCVELMIYNLRGRLIDRMDYGNQSAGSYHFSWDSEMHSSGLYVYVLKTDSGTFKKKMLLIK
ncbi:T9SS type A sorting domain-containing protein [bacterium]|nr:T9SS type A sorting domain-containing protein [bacterium]